MITLSPKALARWVWMRGQSVVDDVGRLLIVVAIDGNKPILEASDGGCIFLRRAPEPDLSDPVTAACLPMVVRAAWNAPKSSVWYCPLARRWELNVQTATRLYVGDTEAEAWIAALEAAP